MLHLKLAYKHRSDPHNPSNLPNTAQPIGLRTFVRGRTSSGWHSLKQTE